MPEVELSSGTIDYEDTGGEGPVVVMIHGLIMDGSLWRNVIESLGERCRCIAPTLPLGGHRHAMRADADLSMRGIAELLGELLEALEPWLLPYLARVPGGIAAAVMPLRFDRLRRLPVTYGPLSRRPVAREVMDRWFGPATQQREIRRELLAR